MSATARFTTNESNGYFDNSDSEAENLFALSGSSSLELRTVPSPATFWLIAPGLVLIWRMEERGAGQARGVSNITVNKASG